MATDLPDKMSNLEQFVAKAAECNSIPQAYIDVFGAVEGTVPSARAFLLWNSPPVKEIRNRTEKSKSGLDLSKDDIVDMIMNVFWEAELKNDPKSHKIRLECIDKLSKIQGLYNPIQIEHEGSLLDILKERDISYD